MMASIGSMDIITAQQCERITDIFNLCTDYLSTVEIWVACEDILFGRWGEDISMHHNVNDASPQSAECVCSDDVSQTQLQNLLVARDRLEGLAAIILVSSPIDGADANLIAAVAFLEDDFAEFGGTDSAGIELLKSAFALC
jgi:hypothetical protein